MIVDTSWSTITEISETIWYERFNLSRKNQPFKIVVEKVLSGDVSII